MNPRAAPSAPTLPFSALSDAELLATLRKHRIGLTVEEARKITGFLKRDPTVVEATIWGIQGSEHSSYKSSRRFLKTFPTQGRHVILGPGEDSGIVAITDGPPGKRWGLVVSHESHNHPSQIVPFEGAATGIGGVVRDVVCMGARVIGCMDMLRLGDLKTEETRTIAEEVIRGIAGYGNPLGIPNLGGDTVCDTAYNGNCLVNALALGIVREDEVIHSFAPAEAGSVGYDIIIVGKPTDRSGFGGAAFASISMEKEKREQNTGAVQEPNPFLERHLLAATYALFDWLAAEGKLGKVSFKDLGAGGTVCATVEQVAEPGFGAEICLDAVHVAIPDLPPEVIACAETQERFCWICHPDLTGHILRHYNEIWDLPNIAERAGASVVGKVTTDGIYRLTHHGAVVCEAKARDITSGLLYERPTRPAAVERREAEILCEGERITLRANVQTFKRSNVRTSDAEFRTTITEVFRAMLRHPNGASKAPAFLHFDKTVIGNTLVEAGEADAGVFLPLQDLESYVHDGAHPGWELSEAERHVGVAVAADGNGRYGRISPYWQGFNAAVEAMRNVAASGALPRALTDCLNYGNPEIPEHLWALEEGVRGIADAARGVAIGGEAVPVISGNVSLYNSRPDGSAIDPTAIVACVGVLPDGRRAVTMQLKDPGSVLVLAGERREECGGSLYGAVLEEMAGLPRDALLGSGVPKPDAAAAGREIAFVVRCCGEGLVRACHDVSDGGLLLALFEMSLPQRKTGGAIGAEVDLEALGGPLRPDVLLFSETGGFLLELDPKDLPELQERAEHAGLTVTAIGKTLPSTDLRIRRGGEVLLEERLTGLRTFWESGLSEALKNG